MTATERLRNLLDERGVEYTGVSRGKTEWWSDFNEEITVASDWGKELCVSVVLTPEQAVAVTLGADTCRFVYSLADNGWADHTCDSCGYSVNMDVQNYPDFDYCPGCGKKVER